MDFPRLVYKSADEHELVNDTEELTAACKRGWFASVPEALAGGTKPVQKPTEPADDLAPPTRAELELKAKELNIKFTAKTTDAELGAAIAKKL
jgi:hypothetical protein